MSLQPLLVFVRLLNETDSSHKKIWAATTTTARRLKFQTKPMCDTQQYARLLFNKSVTSFGGFNSGYSIGQRDLNPRPDFIRRLTDHFNLIIWQLTLHHFYSTAINNFDKDNELLHIVLLLYAIGHRARTLGLFFTLSHCLSLSVCQPEHKGQKSNDYNFNVAMTFSIGFYFRVEAIVTNNYELTQRDRSDRIGSRSRNQTTVNLSHSPIEWLEMEKRRNTTRRLRCGKRDFFG